MGNKELLDKFESAFDINLSSSTEEGEDDSEVTAEKAIALSTESFDVLSKEVAEEVTNLSSKGSKIDSVSVVDIVQNVLLISSNQTVEDINNKIKTAEVQEIEKKKENMMAKLDLSNTNGYALDSLDTHTIEQFVPDKIGDVLEEKAAENVIFLEEKKDEICEKKDEKNEGKKAEIPNISNMETEEENEEDLGKKIEEMPSIIAPKQDSFNSTIDTLPDISDEDEYTPDGQLLWRIKSPSRLWDSFYREKSKFVKYHLVGGQLPYEKLMKELGESSSDVSTEVFDPRLICALMDNVNKHIQRVQQIGVQVNNQFFVWKRFTEIMRGCIARVECLKPASKQDGLIYEHMRDMEYYNTRLESLQTTVAEIMRTLNRSFDALSRKLSMCQPIREGEKLVVVPYKASSNVIPPIQKEKTVQQEQIIKQEQPYQFETLEEGLVAVPKKPLPTNGFVDFSDIDI